MPNKNGFDEGNTGDGKNPELQRVPENILLAPITITHNIPKTSEFRAHLSGAGFCPSTVG